MVETAAQDHAVLLMGLLVLAVLVIATIAVGALRRLKPAADIGELVTRVRSWWVMAAVFFAAVAVLPALSLVLFGLMSFWALREYLALLDRRPADRLGLVLGYASIPIQYAWVAIAWYGMFSIFVPVYVFLALPVALLLAGETRGFVAAASRIQWGLMAFVFGLSHMAFLLELPLLKSPAAASGVDGRTLLLFLVFVVEMSDVLQYVWGKTLGRHKVLPAISPNKTWEGLAGGIATTTALSLLLRFLTPFSVAETLAVAAGLTVAGFFGGAVMSAVKRDFGVKDFGGTIPGHGGVLDRVDSLCWAAPLFFHYVRYFHGA